LKGLIALKGIKFLFAACKKGLDIACKIQKIRENQRVLHAVVKYLPAAYKRGTDCMRYLRIARNTDNVSNMPLRKLNLKIMK
jgi:hypothetical protein